MPKAVISTYDQTVERTYPDGISKVRAIIGRRTDLPLGRHIPSPVLFSFGVATVNPGGEIAAHTHHDREELFYVQSGVGTLEAEGERMQIGPGTAVWFPVGCRHRFANDTGEPVVVVFVGMTPSDAGTRRPRARPEHGRKGKAQKRLRRGEA